MKTINGIVVLLVLLALSYTASAALLGEPAYMTDSGIRVKDTEAKKELSFIEMAKIIRDSNGFYSTAEGAMLAEDLTLVYNQLIFGTLALTTTDVAFDLVELQDWDNNAQAYKTVYLLELNYNLTKDDGQKFQKRVVFKYEPLGGSFRPIHLSISEAEIDVMNPPIYYYFFEQDGIRLEDIW